MLWSRARIRRKNRSEHAAYEIKKPRWHRRILISAGLLALLVWFAPSIVAHSPLKQRIVSAALSDFDGRVTVGAASLGWLSPLRVLDIVAYDATGATLASAKSVTTEKHLWALLSNQTDLGGIEIDGPQVSLDLHEHGTNWDQALASFQDSPPDDHGPQSVSFKVIGGTLDVRDRKTGISWKVDQMELAGQWASTKEKPIQAALSGILQLENKPPGKVAVNASWTPGQNMIGSGQASLHLDSISLDALNTLTMRSGNLHMLGTASAIADCAWSDDGATSQIDLRQLKADDFALRAPNLLGDDMIQSKMINASGKFVQKSGRTDIQHFSFDSDFARITANGSLPIAIAQRPAAIHQWLTQLQKESVRVDGELDLPAISRMLPNTLRMRPRTKITGGVARLAIATQSVGEPRFTAHMETVGLQAIDNGVHFSLREPLVVDAIIRQTAKGTMIDQLKCQSSFLNIVAQGTLDNGSATVQGDLTRMADELGRFVDLQNGTLAGKLDGAMNWRLQDSAAFLANGVVHLQGFQLSMPGRLPWREQQLALRFGAEGRMVNNILNRLDSASCSLTSGSDRFQAVLTKPVVEPTPNSTFPARVQATGDLATWLPRLQMVAPVEDWKASGTIAISADVNAAAAKVDTKNLSVTAKDLLASNGGVFVNEPHLQLDTTATWDEKRHRILATATSLTSSTVAFRSEQIVVDIPNDQPHVRGQLSYVANLQRALDIFRDPKQPPDQKFSGETSGVVEAKHQDGKTYVNWTANVKDFEFASRRIQPRSARAEPWQQVWQTGLIKASGQHEYDVATDSLKVDSIRVTADAANLTASGSVGRLTTAQEIDLSGEVDYDLKVVSEKLRPLLGPNIQIAGREKNTFRVTGPLHLSDEHPPGEQHATTILPGSLRANAGFGWQSASVFGLPIGTGRVQTQLADAMFRFEPLDVSVSGGRVRFTPTLDFRRHPARLLVGKAKAIDNVQLTPEICRVWLKYIAPVAADATRAEGRFSLAVESAEVPLIDRMATTAAGAMTVHSAKIGPGPLAQQLLGLVGQLKGLVDGNPAASNQLANTPWLIIPEQQVPFRVEKGRVHHREFTMNVQEVVVRTTGSVGLDQTMAMTAEILIPDSWVARNRLLSSLKGTKVQIPIQGTLSSPKIDRSALANLNRKLIQGAAGNLLEKELSRGLQQLFGPRQ